jgi:hypothetical protein
LGEDWLEKGFATMRFSAPSYDGELVTAGQLVTPNGLNAFTIG